MPPTPMGGTLHPVLLSHSWVWALPLPPSWDVWDIELREVESACPGRCEFGHPDVLLGAQMSSWVPRCVPRQRGCTTGEPGTGCGCFQQLCRGLRPRSAGGKVLGSSLGARNEFLGEA